jgi:hypothetical protein
MFSGMGGFGSGRSGGRVTAEATASYILSISSLKPFIGKKPHLTCTTAFDEGKFPIAIRFDTERLCGIGSPDAR